MGGLKTVRSSGEEMERGKSRTRSAILRGIGCWARTAVMLVLWIVTAVCGAFGSAQAQSWDSNAVGPLHRLMLRAGAGTVVPAGGTGGVMDVGWDVGGGIGFRVSHRLSVLASGQYLRTGVGKNVLQYQLMTNGSYEMWTGMIDPMFTLWRHGRYEGNLTGGGGYSRILTTMTGPATGNQCYLLCICPQGCSSTTGSGTATYDYSSNQPIFDAGVELTRRLRGMKRSQIFFDARYEDLMEGSNLAPFRNVQVIPLTVGLEW